MGIQQPPSGGCVLKQGLRLLNLRNYLAAAFGRLCVETCANVRINVFNEGSRLRAAVC